MDHGDAHKNDGGGTGSVVRALWDPFGFMEAMFGWRQPGVRPLFEITETDDTYVCSAKVQLTLPGGADVAHATAKLENGELTLVVPKAPLVLPEPASPPAQAAESAEEMAAAPPAPRRAKQSRKTGKSGRKTGRRASTTHRG